MLRIRLDNYKSGQWSNPNTYINIAPNCPNINAYQIHIIRNNYRDTINNRTYAENNTELFENV